MSRQRPADEPRCLRCHRKLASRYSGALLPLVGVPGAFEGVCGPDCPKLSRDEADQLVFK